MRLGVERRRGTREGVRGRWRVGRVGCVRWWEERVEGRSVGLLARGGSFEASVEGG